MFNDLNARIRAHADREPSRTALTFAPAHLGLQRVALTYGEVAEQSEALARVLARRMGRGERALLLFPAAPEFTVSFLACLAAGVIAVPVPIPVDESALRRVVNVARDCGVTQIVSLSFVHEFAASGAPEMQQLCRTYEWLLVDDLDSVDALAGVEDGTGGTRGLPRRISSDDIAFLQYTSGSTSNPRGVVVTHENLMSNEAAIGEAFGVRPDSRIVSWLPLHHDMGLIGGMLQPLYAGATGFVLEPLSFVQRPASWLETVSQERADISGGPNFAYDLCARKVSDEELAGLDLSSWRVAFNGAAQVFPRTLRRFDERFRSAGFRPSSHLPCYGLAEGTLLVAGSSPAPTENRAFASASLEAGRAVEVPQDDPDAQELVAYRLLRHASVRVVDPATTEPVGEGVTGEILVAGDSNGAGYWEDDARTADTFRIALPGEEKQYLRTGDLGFLYSGQLYVQGRCKDLVIHRGRNLYPEDLEADVSVCDPGLRPGCCAVFGVANAPDEDLVVCQEVRREVPPEAYGAIADRIRRTLSRIHSAAAHTVLLVPPGTVPKTSSGKVQRQATKQLFLAGELRLLHSDIEQPVPPSEAGLAAHLAWAGYGRVRGGPADRAATLTEALRDHLVGLLRLPERPSGEESLIELGLDSMQAVRLQCELEEALGVALRPTALLRAASVRELARLAEEQRAALPTGQPDASGHAVEAGPAQSGDAPYELTTAQRSLWFLQRAYPDGFGYNVTRAFRLTGGIDPGRLADAVASVVRRHPSLRLSVGTVDGEPHGVVRADRVTALERLDARTWTADQQAEWHREFATAPFDLQHDPLLRAALLRRPEDWLLVLSLHHIVCDLSSLGTVVDDLARAYTCGADDAPEAIRPVTCLSPAEQERAVLSERGDELTAFWRDELGGDLPTLTLPSPERPQTDRTAASHTFRASGELTARLIAFAREAGLTPHNVLLSAFQVLLHRFSGQPDLVVGVPASTRHRSLADWVGYLVNVVPVRSRYAATDGFAAFATRTQQRVLDVMEHQDLPLPEITRLANPDRDNPAASVFRAMFSYYSAPLPGGTGSAAAVVLGDPGHSLPLGADGAALHGHPVPDFTTQSDLCLNVLARQGAFEFEFQYDPRTVPDDLADRIRTSFLTLLDAVGAAPGTAVRRLPLLSADDMRERVDAGRGPSAERPADYLDVFEELADSRPDALAVDDGTTRLTYAELDARANHVAARLRARGVGVDDNVVVCARRSTGYWVAVLGIHKASGCYVPISPTESPRRAADMAAAVDPVAAIADERSHGLLADALTAFRPGRAPDPLDLAELTAGSSKKRAARIRPAHGASYIMYTSGSTGAPKPIVATNDGVHNHMWQMIERFGLGPEDCVGQTAPVTVDLTIWQFMAPLLVGGSARIIPEPVSLSPRGLLGATLDGGVTVLELVPSAIAALLDAGLADGFGRLRAMVATGDPLTAELPPRWGREMPAVPLYNAYGSTECTDDVSIALSAHGTRVPPVTIGRPLANSTMLVLDDDLNPVPVGVVGSLYAGGRGVTRGYRGNPRRTAAAFVPDPWSATPGARLYRTGDLTRVTPSGDVEFHGRDDGQVKIRGLRVDILQAEAALRDCEQVADGAVQVTDGRTGEFLVAHVVLRDRLTEVPAVLDASEDRLLRAALEDRLPRHMVPTVLVKVPKLPRTGTGKIDYRSLEYSGPLPSADDGAEWLDDPVASVVRAAWADVLGIPAMSWQDSFFQLGGHSLLAVGMVDRVSQALDVELEIGTVFSHPRLCDFVTAVRHAEPTSLAGGTRTTYASPDEPVPASAAQQRFWFLHEMDPDSSTYSMPGVLRLRGDLDETALEAALREVLARHRVLLARFSSADGVLRWTAAAPEEFELPRLDMRGAVAEFGDMVFDRMVAEEAARPVDLRREFPFRAVLARLGAQEWRLLVTIDHIACDGWSLSVFMEDLAACYNRWLREPDAPARDTAQFSFADYCHEEQAYLERRDPDETARTWSGLGDGPVVLSPLVSRAGQGAPAAPAATRAGRHVDPIDDALAEKIRATARRTGTTPYMVFATALSALTVLSNPGGAGRQSVLLGMVVAQRDRPEWRRVVGPLLNVSVLAVDLSPADTADEALQRTREGALRAYRACRVPFQEIASCLPTAPHGDGSPFEVMLVMQPSAADTGGFEGLTTDLQEAGTGEAPYPLTIDIEAHGDGYRLAFRYAAERYAQSDVEDLAAHLREALHSIAAAPGSRIEELLTRAHAPLAERT